MLTVLVELPPGLNHGYFIGHGKIHKSGTLVAWENTVALALKRQEPLPEKTPLVVMISVYLPMNTLRRSDVDGFVKFAVDALVGKRADQWVDSIYVRKYGVRVGHPMANYISMLARAMTEEEKQEEPTA